MKKLQAPIISTDKEKSVFDLNPVVFSQKLDPKTLAKVIKVYQSNSHQQTRKVKTRSEVAGSTRKLYQQKGTGNARHGSITAPIYVGGGVAKGPTGIRPMMLKVSQKLRSLALASVLTTKLSEDAIFIIKAPQTDKPSTKSILNLLKDTDASHKSISFIRADSDSDEFIYSTRNIANADLVAAASMNAYQASKSDLLVFTPDAIELLQTRLLAFLKSK